MISLTCRTLLATLSVSSLVASLSFANKRSDHETWRQFRGNSGSAIAVGQDVPISLSRDTLRWSKNLPGPGTSSPVIWGERLYITSDNRASGQTKLSCLNAMNGEEIWSRSIEGGDYETHQFNNLASGTPSVSEDFVVLGWLDVASNHAKLSAYTHSGKTAWVQDLGPYVSQHGVAINPVISGNSVFINFAHRGGGYTGAYRLDNGSPIWSSPNPDKAKASYSAPIVRDLADSDEKEVIAIGELMGMIGFDFETGNINWSLPDAFHHRTIASPIIINGFDNGNNALVAAGDKSGNFFAARVPHVENGEIVRAPKIEWMMEKQTPYVPTPVSDGKTIFALNDGGALTAMDAETGSVIWRDKLLGNFYASPILVGGKLYCLSRDGVMWVAEAGDSFKVLRVSELNPPDDGKWSDATPAVAHNRMYVRLGSRLDCY